MQLTHLAMALFAAVVLGAPAAAPTDIVDTPTTTATHEAVTFTVPHGKTVPVPQGCCWIFGKGIGCGKKLCG
jgi:hypothetical protein